MRVSIQESRVQAPIDKVFKICPSTFEVEAARIHLLAPLC